MALSESGGLQLTWITTSNTLSNLPERPQAGKSMVLLPCMSPCSGTCCLLLSQHSLHTKMQRGDIFSSSFLKRKQLEQLFQTWFFSVAASYFLSLCAQRLAENLASCSCKASGRCYSGESEIGISSVSPPPFGNRRSRFQLSGKYCCLQLRNSSSGQLGSRFPKVRGTPLLHRCSLS